MAANDAYRRESAYPPPGDITPDDYDLYPEDEDYDYDYDQPEPSRGACGDYVIGSIVVLLELLTSTMGLFVLNLTYLLLGSYIFITIEAPAEKSLQNNLQEGRADLVKSLIELGRGPEDAYFANASQRLALFEGALASFYRKRATLKQGFGNTTESLKLWNARGSIIFCFSVMTTIGWGNIVPSTSSGRLGTILYGLFGVPLLFTLNTEVGGILNSYIYKMWKVVRAGRKKLMKKWVTGQDNKGEEAISSSDDDNEEFAEATGGAGEETTDTAPAHATNENKSPNRYDTDTEPLLGSKGSTASNSSLFSPILQAFHQSSKQMQTGPHKNLMTTSNNSAYLRSVKSSLDFMVQASDIKSGLDASCYIPRYRILTKKDARMLVKEFASLSPVDLVRSMQFVGLNYNELTGSVGTAVDDVSKLEEFVDQGVVTQSDYPTSCHANVDSTEDVISISTFSEQADDRTYTVYKHEDQANDWVMAETIPQSMPGIHTREKKINYQNGKTDQALNQRIKTRETPKPGISIVNGTFNEIKVDSFAADSASEVSQEYMAASSLVCYPNISYDIPARQKCDNVPPSPAGPNGTGTPRTRLTRTKRTGVIRSAASLSEPGNTAPRNSFDESYQAGDYNMQVKDKICALSFCSSVSDSKAEIQCSRVITNLSDKSQPLPQMAVPDQMVSSDMSNTKCTYTIYDGELVSVKSSNFGNKQEANSDVFCQMASNNMGSDAAEQEGSDPRGWKELTEPHGDGNLTISNFCCKGRNFGLAGLKTSNTCTSFVGNSFISTAGGSSVSKETQSYIKSVRRMACTCSSSAKIKSSRKLKRISPHSKTLVTLSKGKSNHSTVPKMSLLGNRYCSLNLKPNLSSRKKSATGMKTAYDRTLRLSRIFEEVFRWEQMDLPVKQSVANTDGDLTKAKSPTKKCCSAMEYYMLLKHELRKSSKTTNLLSSSPVTMLRSRLQKSRNYCSPRPGGTDNGSKRTIDHFVSVTDGLAGLGSAATSNVNTSKAPRIVVCKHAGNHPPANDKDNAEKRQNAKLNKTKSFCHTLQHGDPDVTDVANGIVISAANRQQSDYYCSLNSKDSDAKHITDYVTEWPSAPDSFCYHNGHVSVTNTNHEKEKQLPVYKALVSEEIVPDLTSYGLNNGSQASWTDASSGQSSIASDIARCNIGAHAGQDTPQQAPYVYSYPPTPTTENSAGLVKANPMARDAIQLMYEKENPIMLSENEDISDSDSDDSDLISLEGSRKRSLPVVALYVCLFVFVLAGSIWYSVDSDTDLDLATSIYFMYVLLSTTGFGDLLPPNEISMHIILFIYSVIGMALFNIMISSILEMFMSAMDYLNYFSAGLQGAH